MRGTAVALLALTTLWALALVITAVDMAPGLLSGQGTATDSPAVVIASGLGAALMGLASVALVGALVRSRRAGGPPRWARPLAVASAVALALGAAAGLGGPVTFLLGVPAIAFAAAALALRGAPAAPRGP
jgi:hypothetical protein